MDSKRVDEAVDGAVKRTLAAGASSALTCPDDNALSAYLEGQLSATEGAALEDHASHCGKCQEVIALSIQLAPRERDLVPSGGPRRILFRFSIPLPVLTLIVVAVGVGILYVVQNASTGHGPAPVQVAQSVRPPAQISAVPSTLSAPATTVADNRPTLPKKPRDRGTPAKVMDSRPEEGPSPLTFGTLSKKAEKAQPLAATTPAVLAVSAAAEPAIMDRVQEKEARDSFAGRAAGARNLAMALRADEKVSVPVDTSSVRNTIRSLGGVIQNSPGRQEAPESFPDQKKAALAAAPAEAKAPYREQKIGARDFYRVSGVWIDKLCVSNPDAEIVEITENAKDFSEILKAFPQIEELRKQKSVVALFLNAKIFLVHFDR